MSHIASPTQPLSKGGELKGSPIRPIRLISPIGPKEQQALSSPTWGLRGLDDCT